MKTDELCFPALYSSYVCIHHAREATEVSFFMNRYENIPCPICKKPLGKDEDIVVCPECGAPYHRTCYMETGHCIFPELHASGASWKPERREEQGTAADERAGSEVSGVKIYPRCGGENPPDGLFCKICGTPLEGREQGQPQNGGAPYGMPPFTQGMPFSPFMRPNTVSPEEEIDGIKAQDYAAFVGRSAHYFLPRFKELSDSKTRVINWSAFFFQGGYFLYRKMYGLGILVFLLNLIVSLPQTYLIVQSMMSPTSLSGSNVMQSFTAVSMICEVLTLILRFVCGFLANTLYKKHCQKQIQRIQDTGIAGEEYRAALTKKGGVAAKLITGLLIGYAAINMIAYILLAFL